MFCKDSALRRVTEGILFCGLVAGLAGCGVVAIPKYPLASDSKLLKDLRTKYSDTGENVRANLDQCQDAICQRNERNRILEELILLIDFEYHKYEGNLIAGRANAKFGFGIATQALSLASTTSTVETTKTIFSGISTLVGSTDTEFDKNYYLEQTSYALAHQMQAQRLTVSTDILLKMKKGYNEYSLERGLADIEAYYRAGTIATAVQNVYQGASEKITEAQDTRKNNGL